MFATNAFGEPDSCAPKMIAIVSTLTYFRALHSAFTQVRVTIYRQQLQSHRELRCCVCTLRFPPCISAVPKVSGECFFSYSERSDNLEHSAMCALISCKIDRWLALHVANSDRLSDLW